MAETFSYQNLIAGDFPRVTEAVTILSGAGALAAGTVLGKVTASGKLVPVDSAGTDDGRRTPYAVLSAAVDATSADAVGTVWLTGEFAGAALVFGGTDTTATHKAALRDLGIYIKSAVAV